MSEGGRGGVVLGGVAVRGFHYFGGCRISLAPKVAIFVNGGNTKGASLLGTVHCKLDIFFSGSDAVKSSLLVSNGPSLGIVSALTASFCQTRGTSLPTISLAVGVRTRFGSVPLG